MVTQEDKQALWAMIRKQHPEFGRRLKEGKDAHSDYVAIDQYSNRTNRWLMDAISTQRPDLAELIVTQVKPDAERMRKLWNPEIAVPVDDLIEALVAFEAGRNRSMQSVGVG